MRRPYGDHPRSFDARFLDTDDAVVGLGETKKKPRPQRNVPGDDEKFPSSRPLRRMFDDPLPDHAAHEPSPGPAAGHDPRRCAPAHRSPQHRHATRPRKGVPPRSSSRSRRPPGCARRGAPAPLPSPRRTPGGRPSPARAPPARSGTGSSARGNPPPRGGRRGRASPSPSSRAREPGRPFRPSSIPAGFPPTTPSRPEVYPIGDGRLWR